ncbi:MAG: hypothetical protein K2Z81_24545 [Cyanobacteria bacterium]|nr:hypothetical protein [Cyanobacteriota bacterium]
MDTHNVREIINLLFDSDPPLDHRGTGFLLSSFHNPLHKHFQSIVPLKIRIVTPGTIVMHVFMLLVLLMQSFSTISGMVSHLDLSKQNVAEAEIKAQLRSIKRRLLSGEDEFQGMIMPEGIFLSNVFYGYSLVNLALSQPTNAALKEEALREVERLVIKLKPFYKRTPFCQTQRSLPGGVIYQGNINRLRAGYALLGGTNPEIIKDFHEGGKLLYLAFSEIDPPFPESFWGLTWPVDGVPALDALRLHDLLYKTDSSTVFRSWTGWLKAHLDPKTKLMIAQAGVNDDSIVDGTRGCAMSWTLALLPPLDEQFDKAQYEIFRTQWFQPFGWGFLGINEWYHAEEMPSDFKPGPVVGGLGAAATGLGIAATRVNGDYSSWHKILRSLELLGLPLYTIYGEKSYFLGQSLLCDTIALWGKTIVHWQAQIPTSSFTAISDDNFFFSIAACLLISVLACGLLLARTLSLIRSEQYTRPERTRLIVGVALFQSALLGLWLFTPLLAWMQAFIIMAIANLLEEMTIRPKIVSRLFKERDEQERSSKAG